jgi:hypothetical protein
MGIPPLARSQYLKAMAYFDEKGAEFKRIQEKIDVSDSVNLK